MPSEVIFYDQEEEEELATVDVEVADDPVSRYVGLSDTESLGADEGMLFMYPGEGERSFVMRDMNFDLDIIMVDAEGEITEIHEAPAPAGEQTDRTLEEYSGLAQAVVEVPMGYSSENNIEVGDYIDVILAG